MEREGENTFSYGFSFPCTRSLRIIADTMEVVMPHLLKPVATYRSVVEAEYVPIYGTLSRLIQSCVAQWYCSSAWG